METILVIGGIIAALYFLSKRNLVAKDKSSTTIDTPSGIMVKPQNGMSTDVNVSWTPGIVVSETTDQKKARIMALVITTKLPPGEILDAKKPWIMWAMVNDTHWSLFWKVDKYQIGKEIPKSEWYKILK